MPARPPVPVPRSARSRARWWASAIVLIALAAGASASSGATSGTVVTAVIPSATSLDGAGCAPGLAGVTEFGAVQPTTSAVTSGDCVLVWGSSNATSMLRTFQSDAVGSAMGAASASWTAKSTRDTGGFDDISAASASIAYGSAGGAGVRYTTNGGGIWNSFDPGAPNVRDVAAVPGVSSTAVLVGDSGIVHRTTTTGAAWPAETSGTPTALRGVSMFDATNGFAVGDAGQVIRRTTGGGSTWTVVTNAGAAQLLGVSAASTNVAFVAGSGGALYRTDNGGSTWTAAGGGCNYTFTDVVSTDLNTAFAVAQGGRVVRLFWNGVTLACTDLTSNANVGEDLRGVSTDGSSIYAAGAMGTLIKSSNLTAGASWSRVLPGTAADLGGVSTPSDTSIWVAGSSSTVSRAPTGTTFTVVNVETNDSTTLTAVAGVSDTTAYVVGGQVDRGGTWQASIRKTTNGGGAWTSQTSSTTNALFGVDVVGDGTIAYASGDNGTIVQTTNGGTTWTARSVAAAGTRLWDIDMVDDVYGWAVGDNGTVVRTSNGGTSWVAQSSGVTNALSGISAVDKDIAFAVGTTGRVLRTTNGGTTWSSMTGIPTTQSLDDVSASSAKVVWVAVGYQQLLHATDADVATPTWALRSTGTGGNHYSIDSASPTAVFVGAAWNEVNRTRDGGTTWSTDNVGGASMQIYGIDAIDENSAWGVGSDNAVALTETAAATSFGDYLDAGPNWSSGTSIFAACLRQSTGTNVTPTWTEDAGCTAAGVGVWKGIPTTSAGASSKIAGATAATTGTARLRFGMFVGANQPPGRYTAGLTFEVVAPNA